MKTFKSIIIRGTKYDDILNKLTHCGYTNLYHKPLTSISITPDFGIVLSARHDIIYPDLLLRIYNPAMLADQKVKEVLLEYVI